ncbi:hypothetical protein FQA39_LY07988 [Lamprigera yunnana]|nr:hypothetical protein FQA39_LY07988 [Lamprigera yunnana]
MSETETDTSGTLVNDPVPEILEVQNFVDTTSKTKLDNPVEHAVAISIATQTDAESNFDYPVEDAVAICIASRNDANSYVNDSILDTDTAAAKSYVRDNFAQQLSARGVESLPFPTGIVRLTDESCRPTEGVFNLELEILGTIVHLQCQHLPDLSTDCILGIDFLAQYQVQLDFADKTIRLQTCDPQPVPSIPMPLAAVQNITGPFRMITLPLQVVLDTKPRAGFPTRPQIGVKKDKASLSIEVNGYVKIQNKPVHYHEDHERHRAPSSQTSTKSFPVAMQPRFKDQKMFKFTPSEY